MKNFILAVVILIVGTGIILEGRYEVKIDSPVVARIDRLTGDVWIVNSGVWRKVQMPLFSQERGDNSQEKSANAR